MSFALRWLALLALPLVLGAGPALAKAKLKKVSLSAADATAQIPVGWTVANQNAAAAHVLRPGREAPIILQGVDAATPTGAILELVAALAALALHPDRFSEVEDATLKGAMLFAGEVTAADGTPKQYYGLVRLSGFGGGVAVWTLGVLEEQDWRDVAGVMRRVTFQKPKPAKLVTHRVMSPGLGIVVDVPARGFVVEDQKDAKLQLVAAKPMRRLLVELKVGMSDDAHGIVRQQLQSAGVRDVRAHDLPGGGAYGLVPSAFELQGHTYDVLWFARHVAGGVGYTGIYAVRFDMGEAQLRQALELLAAMKAAPEPKSQAAKAAEAQLGGKYLLAGLHNMGSNTSASRSEQWTFCSDRSYAYDYQSVISLGEFGGSVKEDHHSGRWVVVDGSDGGLWLLLDPRDGRGRLRLPLQVRRDGIFIDGSGFRFGRSDRCR